ncbi:hypothetical protein [Paenibacillus crassostreae]|uniref:Uncharacterized protein n=1 Tax=Paenibacillus crassostreae TaxID=1763538 RepID=A0A167DSK5_9BACL|nr:hypothetical protein [Paenibacillus crassostreae]AOZ91109.1 hypothetical protein LPB68_02070 [Paenibacillus crassostreae]OAB74731.1 hypothetical protein PNBC_11885 [Paenibacillus crassostreae]
MKYGLFIGVSDISDLIHYLSKVITNAGQKVLLVDATLEKYTLLGTPIPNKDMKVIDFEGFDVVSGFSNLSDLEQFLSEINTYNQVIIHCGTPYFLKHEELLRIDKKYVAVTAENWSIQKTVEIMKSFYEDEKGNNRSDHYTKISLNNVDTSIADNYLETVLSDCTISWAEEPFELLFDEIDYATKINNQHQGKINMKKLSKNYKHVIQLLTKELTNLNDKDIKKAMKLAMRRN